MKEQATKLFEQMYRDGERSPTVLAKACGVSRQTIYHWISQLDNPEQLHTKTKPRRYAGETKRVTIKLPVSTIEKLQEANKGLPLKRIIEDTVLNSLE